MHVVHSWEVLDAAGIGRVRHGVTALLGSGVPSHLGLVEPPDAERTTPGGLADLRSRMALSCSELVTNALRHGRPPIEVRLLTDGSAWMLDVTDTAVDRLPDPHPVRPLGKGGYGLLLVARLASHLGWYVNNGAKHVWARLEIMPDTDLVDELASH